MSWSLKQESHDFNRAECQLCAISLRLNSSAPFPGISSSFLQTNFPLFCVFSGIFVHIMYILSILQIFSLCFPGFRQIFHYIDALVEFLSKKPQYHVFSIFIMYVLHTFWTKNPLYLHFEWNICPKYIYLTCSFSTLLSFNLDKISTILRVQWNICLKVVYISYLCIISL